MVSNHVLLLAIIDFTIFLSSHLSQEYMALPPGAPGLTLANRHPVENPFTLEEDIHLLHTAATLRATNPFTEELEEIGARFVERFPGSVRTHRQLRTHLIALVQSQHNEYSVRALKAEADLPAEQRVSWQMTCLNLHIRTSLIYYLRKLRHSRVPSDRAQGSERLVDPLPPTSSVVVLASDSEGDQDVGPDCARNPRNSNSGKKRSNRAPVKREKRVRNDGDQGYGNALKISQTAAVAGRQGRALSRKRTLDAEAVIEISDDEAGQQSQTPPLVPRTVRTLRAAASHGRTGRNANMLCYQNDPVGDILNSIERHHLATPPSFQTSNTPNLPSPGLALPNLSLLDPSSLNESVCPSPIISLPATTAPTTDATFIKPDVEEPEIRTRTGTASNSSLTMSTSQTTGQPGECRPTGSLSQRDPNHHDHKNAMARTASSPGPENSREEKYDAFFNSLLMNTDLDESPSPSPLVNTVLMPRSMALSDNSPGQGRLQGLLDDLDQINGLDDDNSITQQKSNP